MLILYSSVTASDSSQGILRKYETKSTTYTKANTLLNTVKLKTASRSTAQKYIRELEDVIRKYPDYPHLAEAYYFLGVNCQFAGEWNKAINAFSTALELNPALANQTPIQSYLRTSREHYFSEKIPLWLRIGIVLFLIFFIALGIYFKSWEHLQPRVVAAWGGGFVLWMAVYAWAAFLDTPEHVPGLESYPKPVLLNTTLFTEGSEPLKMVFWYGTAAFFGSLLILCSCLGLSKSKKRVGISIVAVLMFSACCMALCYMQTCYMRGETVTRGGVFKWRINIMARNISFVNEIPDKMLPLYDEDFRNKIIKRREENK